MPAFTRCTWRQWRSFPIVVVLAPLAVLALIGSGCGTAEGNRYDSAPPPSIEHLQESPAPPPSTGVAPRQDASRGIDTTLDYAREWRSDSYVEQQAKRRAAREKAERRAREEAELRRTADESCYDGANGYPYVDTVTIGGVTYRRIWQAPGTFILDGEPTWDGYGFRYAASSGAQVYQSTPHTRPRTEYERRIQQRRYPAPGTPQQTPTPRTGWRAGGFTK